MGSCTRRHFLLSTCFLQLITIIERQVFDFLGYMWAPIFVNFFQILFVIFGFYGAYHFRVKYIITYLLWSFLWIGWNAFLICFYLDVGELNKNSDLLNLGTGSASWFEVNSYGCKPTYPTNITSEDPYRPIRPESVDGCLLDYTWMEVIHSGVQCALAFFGIIGAILISYIFLDEDDRFDFMNGDAKSPQHTVVHPMYVSYTSIPTSASATMLSNKHQHANHQHINQQHHPHHHALAQQQQQHTYNNNTFLIHSNSNTPNASNNNTLNNSKRFYSSKNKISASATTIIPTTTAAAILQQQQQQKPYDDSTAKADHQLYTNSKRQQQQQQQLLQQHQQHIAVAPLHSNNNNSCSTLSYASLQKYSAPNSQFEFSSSNSNMASGSLRSAAAASATVAAAAVGAALSNSNLSTNSMNNNNHNNNSSSNSNNNGSGRFARIHNKPQPPKTSASYSSFINASNAAANNYDQQSPGCSNSFAESYEEEDVDDDVAVDIEEDDDDVAALASFGNANASYVPFQKPTPGRLLTANHNSKSNNNNSSYGSLRSNYSGNGNHNNNSSISPNNNSSICMSAAAAAAAHPLTRDNALFFLRNDNDLLLERSAHAPPPPQHQQQLRQATPFLNPANRAILQQNGLPFLPLSSSTPPPPTAASSSRPTRPSNIPLPTVPQHQQQLLQRSMQSQHHPQQQQQHHHLPSQHYHQQQHYRQQAAPPPLSPTSSLSPSAVTPPPPPAPRPHIFQPRSGNAPYPDLSPEVTERYAMPTQYVPRSPIASRIARRQRQQQQHERSHLANTSANFCDQIRDAPPGYIGNGFNIVRAKSHDRLSTSLDQQQLQSTAAASAKSQPKDAAPQVNRRSGRSSGGKTRPRSYCNSSAGGEGVIRGVPAVLAARQAGYEVAIVGGNGAGGGAGAVATGGAAFVS